MNIYPKNFEYTYKSILQLKQVIDELTTLYKFRSDEKEFLMIRHPMFTMVHHSLMYILVMEHCKLTEPCNPLRKEHYASLIRLGNRTLIDYKGFEDENKGILERITKIKDSSFGIKIRKLRDRNYAHCDRNSVQLTSPSLTEDEMNELKIHWQEFYNIHQLCSSKFQKEGIIVEWEVRMATDEIEGFIKEYAPQTTTFGILNRKE